MLLPPAPRPSVAWLLASLAINAGFVSWLVWIGYEEQSTVETVVTFIQLGDRVPGPREVAMDYRRPAPVTGSGEATAGSGPRVIDLSPSVAPMAPSRVEVVRPPVDVPDTIDEPRSTSGAVVIGTRRRLGPTFGDGRAWVAAPLTTEERFEIAVAVASLDSVVRERLMDLLAALPADSFALAANPEQWATEVFGQTISIDQQFIQVGGIKIPTMLLALLPIPQGNVDRMREQAQIERTRQEIVENARRQEDIKEIRNAIRELRARKDAERRAKLTGTDSIIAGRDTIIP